MFSRNREGGEKQAATRTSAMAAEVAVAVAANTAAVAIRVLTNHLEDNP